MVWFALKKVFRNWKYGFLALAVSGTAFAFATWYPNFRLMLRMLASPEVPLADRILFPIGLLGSIATNFTLFSASYTVALTLLLGVSISMIVFAFRRRASVSRLRKDLAATLLGTMSGLLGIGCAACGSLFLAPFLMASGGAAFLVSLPLRGGEFGILGVLLLILSIYATARDIQTPIACKIG